MLDSETTETLKQLRLLNTDMAFSRSTWRAGKDQNTTVGGQDKVQGMDQALFTFEVDYQGDSGVLGFGVEPKEYNYNYGRDNIRDLVEAVVKEERNKK